MSKPLYSPNGYLILLKSRSRLTVLVEGSTDKDYLGYSIIKYLNDDKSLNRYSIDSADMISADNLHYGNRDKVLYINSKRINDQTIKDKLIIFIDNFTFSRCFRIILYINSKRINDQTIKDKLIIFIDREYNDFDINDPNIDLNPTHAGNDNLYFTRGHSMENYFFDVNVILDYIEFMHSSKLQSDYKSLIVKHWKELIIYAASISFSIYKNNLIGRSENVFEYGIWDIGANNLILNETFFKSCLQKRGIAATTTQDILTDTYNIYNILSLKDKECRWLAHGHIGMNIIFCGLARILYSCNVDTKTVNDITGYLEIKYKYLVERWYFYYNNNTSDEFPKLFLERFRILLS
jgi:hypothetical protein